MANGWTPERRAKQSADIRRYRPWEKSTGPKTPAGKARASQNGIQHGRFSERELNLFQVIRDYIETTGAKPIHPTKALSWTCPLCRTCLAPGIWDELENDENDEHDDE
jgi:hypothetical protein